MKYWASNFGALLKLVVLLICTAAVALPQVKSILAYDRETDTNQPDTTGHPANDQLTGEWKVQCSCRIYSKGQVVSTINDTEQSLVVIETDSDGSHRLYKFPGGFSEALPRLRKTSETRYAGDATVRGITTLIRQNVELDNGKITITQTIIDTSSRNTLSELTCAGTRATSEPKLTRQDPRVEGCGSDNASTTANRDLARKYKVAREFSDGLAAVATQSSTGDLKWGFVDETGRVAIPLIYDAATSFRGGLAAVARRYGNGNNLKWGVVEKVGPLVTPYVNFDAARIVGEGFAAVGYVVPGHKGLQWNLINRENTTILHGFEGFACFVNGRARTSFIEGNVVHGGYVNKNGDFVPEEN
jgi:hypothetical protein